MASREDNPRNITDSISNIVYECSVAGCMNTFVTIEELLACNHRSLEVQPQTQPTHDSSHEVALPRRSYEIWTEERTEQLLELVRRNYPRLTNRYERNNIVWMDICQALQEHVIAAQANGLDMEFIALKIKELIMVHIPGVTRDQIKSKWNNLKTKYLKFKDKMRTTGESRMQPPQSYDLLEAILGDRPVASPVNRMSLGQVESGRCTPLVHRSSLLEPVPQRRDLEQGPSSRRDPEQGPSSRRDSEQGPSSRRDPEQGPSSRRDPEQDPSSRRDQEQDPEEDLNQPNIGEEEEPPRIDLENQPGGVDPLPQGPQVNIRAGRRRLRGVRRLRPDTHARRVEASCTRLVEETARHNRVQEELMRDRNAMFQAFLNTWRENNNSIRNSLATIVEHQQELLEYYRSSK